MRDVCVRLNFPFSNHVVALVNRNVFLLEYTLPNRMYKYALSR